LPPSSDRYASHLLVLGALVEAHGVERVLELGAGDYSTPAFLAAPGLTRLTSVENDPEWARKVTTDDDRHEVLLVEGAIADHLPPLEDYDLVFVDDSTSAYERARTIRAVLSQPHPPVVIHDAEVPEYAAAIADCSPTPATAVVL
jgi:predicted O-methyltransferase YrrM